MILAICDRFRCLPSQAYAEGTEVLRLLKTEYHGSDRERKEADWDA